MAKKRRYPNKRQMARTHTPAPTPPERRYIGGERKPPTQYGKPFILLEDGNKDTFEFKGGQWVAHPMNIAECRESGLVKQLPQKVNGMTRYEIRHETSADS
jgi:hypothetical protein